MKKLYFPSVILLLLCLSSCTVIGGIFKAGAVVGIISVIVVIALIIWIASMFMLVKMVLLQRSLMVRGSLRAQMGLSWLEGDPLSLTLATIFDTHHICVYSINFN